MTGRPSLRQAVPSAAALKTIPNGPLLRVASGTFFPPDGTELPADSDVT
jgi:hypothetical protein